MYIRATPDGNCLNNSCSILLCGSEALNPLLRAAVSLELLINAQYYTSHPYLQDKLLKNPSRHENTIYNMSLSLEAVDHISSKANSRMIAIV